MREGWEIKRLGEVFEITTGGTPPKKNRQLYGNYIPFVKPPELTNGIVTNAADNLSCEGADVARILPINSILVSCIGNLGKIGINAIPVAFNQQINAIQPSEEHIEPRFMFYQALAPEFLNNLNKLASGTTVPIVNKSKFSSIPIVILPLAEQKWIVSVLDEAFSAIEVAVANAQKNLANARELFETTLNNIFTQKGEGWVEKRLDEVTNFLGGGTPSKQNPRYWNGSIPWVSPKDMKFEHISDSIDKISELAIDNSATKLIPEGAVLIVVRSGILVRTIPTALATRKLTINQDLKAICPLQNLSSQFLSYFMQSAEQHLLATVTRGATVHRLSTDVLKSLVIPLPPMEKQDEIVKICNMLANNTQRLEAIYQRKLDDLAELKQSILQKAFAGELTGNTAAEASIAVDTKTPTFSANVICLAYYQHAKERRDKTFGRVKAQKDLHLVESIGGVDLGRKPQKDAAGPNDFPHLLNAERWAREQEFFEFVKRDNSEGYDFIKLANYDQMKAKALSVLEPYREQLEKVTSLLVNKDTRQAEVFATVHAAWNNLIIKGAEITDEAICYEARENWHPDKLKIDKSKFIDAIAEIRRRNIIPDGSAKYVGKQQETFL